jgi:glutathione S-transferase
MPLIESSSCDLVLYTNPWSRGQIARWMLEETGAAYRQVILDYATTMKAPEYLKINPMGKVPAIQHNGHVVTECAAICAYLLMLRSRSPQLLQLFIGGTRGVDQKLATQGERTQARLDAQALEFEDGADGHEHMVALSAHCARG